MSNNIKTIRTLLKMNYNRLLGTRIKDSRVNKGLSVSQLASRIGVKPETVEMWESGESDPRPNKVNKLSGILGVSMIWLLAGEDEKLADTQHSPDFSATGQLEEKIELAEKMISDLSFLLVDIRAQARKIQRGIDA